MRAKAQASATTGSTFWFKHLATAASFIIRGGNEGGAQL